MLHVQFRPTEASAKVGAEPTTNNGTTGAGRGCGARVSPQPPPHGGREGGRGDIMGCGVRVVAALQVVR